MKKYGWIVVACALFLMGCQDQKSNTESPQKEEVKEEVKDEAQEIDIMMDEIKQLQKAEKVYQKVVGEYKKNKDIVEIAHSYGEKGVVVDIVVQSKVKDEQVKLLAEEIYPKMSTVNKELPVQLKFYRNQKLILKK